MSHTIQDFFQRFLHKPSDEQEILQDAILELPGPQVNALKKQIQDHKDTKNQFTPATTNVEGEGDTKEVSEKDLMAQITDKALADFWGELEKLDPIELVSEDVIDAFKYVGYDPDIVIKCILARGIKHNKVVKEILKDLVDIVTIAIIKGSVTEKNLKKTSDAGKVAYKKYQDLYDLKTGSAKGKDSTFLTVARVAAAVPGTITQVLVNKPEFAKKFSGPFGSSSLPTYLRHQSAAACIPDSLPERLKDFLIGLITAFTSDQSKVLSNSKNKPEELFETQLNYVMTTHGSEHPTQTKRDAIFHKHFSLSADYDKLQAVGQKVKKVFPDFQVLTQQQIDEDMSK